MLFRVGCGHKEDGWEGDVADFFVGSEAFVGIPHDMGHGEYLVRDGSRAWLEDAYAAFFNFLHERGGCRVGGGYRGRD